MQLEINVNELKKNKIFVAMPCYGGNLLGMCAKSCLDLQGLCTQLGIELRFSFIFNESLITRARAYLCDEFIRSGFTHLLFIDADVHFDPRDVVAMLSLNKDVVGGPYPKKSGPANALIVTEDGIKKLKWIVDNKYSGNVLSMSPNLNLEWKRVIGHSVDKGSPDKKWVSIGRWGRKNLVVTEDHECSSLDDILFPSRINYVEAKDMNGKYIIKNIVENGKNNINPLYSELQMKLLVGTLLGDGSITNGYLKFGHSLDQEEYLNLKQNIFGGKISETKNVGVYKGKQYYARFLDCPRNSQILKLHELMYNKNECGKNIKTIKNIIDYIDESSLAFWYMDDGSMLYQKNGESSVIFCTEGFSKEDNELLSSLLKSKWDLETTLTDKSNRISILQKDNDKFFELINSFIIPSLEYKLPEKFRGRTKFDYTKIKSLDYSAELVNLIKYINTGDKNAHHQPRKQYDIGVEDNYNFFMNGHLVHNSIKWQNIIQAVKNKPDITPGELEKCVGDFVFNSVGGTSQFNVGDPLEVLEIGTGFMMIKRRVFDLYKEAYPDKRYKPDHVGQTNFDGSRYIHMYFDCLIDRNPDGSGSERYLSEDYQFCQQVRKIKDPETGENLKIWLCPWMKTMHIGTYAFQGDMQQIAGLIGTL